MENKQAGNMKFEEVIKKHLKHSKVKTILPNRKTQYSAGYDFYSKEEKILEPNTQHMFWTDVKVKTFYDYFLLLTIRSSLAVDGISLANCVAIIDSDYYNNETNDGNIGILLRNFGNVPVKISEGQRIAQGILMKYHETEHDKPLKWDVRVGGIGSTGK